MSETPSESQSMKQGAALYDVHLDAIRRQTDRTFAWLMLAQWLVAILIAMLYSPYAWEGKTRSIHVHLFTALFLGGSISSLPIFLAFRYPGAVLTRNVIAVAQMLWSSVLIHLTGGRIETHFHIFGSLAFLSFYRDWKVLIPATLVTAADHTIRQFLWPESVFGIANPGTFRFLEHAVWVLFEDVFLVLSCLQGEDERKRMVDAIDARDEAVSAREAAEEAARVKSQFLANMSHELRTPINGVIGMAELLGLTPLNAKQRRQVDTIIRSGEALLTIVNDVLDFSKIEAGKLTLTDEKMNPVAIAQRVVEMLSAQARKKNIELVCAIASGVPTSLRGDPGRLQQVLTNLVGNAIKFTERGEVVVRVRMIAEQSDSVRLRFEVTDSGIGIEEAAIGKLFQSFSQLDSSHTRKYGGTGLGLAICRQIVTMMGGEIGVTSQVGKGSTFYFTISLQRTATLTKPTTTTTTGERALRNVSVLVIDDSETARQVLLEQLQEWGASVKSVGSGSEGMQVLRSSSSAFNLVITDQEMPGMSGVELCATMRTAGHSLPVLILSSSARTGSEQDLAGAQWLDKPVDPARLLATAQSMLRGQVQAEPQSMPTPVEKSVGGPLLLLAEDNPVNQQVAVEMLETLGYRVETVENGREAVNAISRNQYAAVLMDCQMPEMNGYEAAQAIRKQETGGKRIPIIAVTAHALSGDRERAISAGMDDYLSKPITSERLGSAVSRWVNQSAATSSSEGTAAIQTTAALDPAVKRSRKVVELLLSQLASFPRQLRESTTKDDRTLVREAAHKFKGSCLAVGAPNMAELCRTVEKDPGRATALLPDIEKEAVRLRQALESELANMAPAAAARP